MFISTISMYYETKSLISCDFAGAGCGEGPVGGQAAEVAELGSAAPRAHRGDPAAPHRRHHRGQARGRRAGREGHGMPCFFFVFFGGTDVT